MKILSKFKDYYDFVAGYDADPRKVFIRENLIISKFTEKEKNKESQLYSEIYNHEIKMNSVKEFFLGEVWFCDQSYPYLFDLNENKIYFNYSEIPEKRVELYNKIKNIEDKWSRVLNKPLNVIFGIKLDSVKKRKWYDFHSKYEVNEVELRKKWKLNTKYQSPVIFSRVREGLFPEIVIGGSLQDIKFNQIKSPQDAYTEIYNWIPYHEPIMPDDPNDLIRFEQKGFDKHSSFRGK